MDERIRKEDEENRKIYEKMMEWWREGKEWAESNGGEWTDPEPTEHEKGPTYMSWRRVRNGEAGSSAFALRGYIGGFSEESMKEDNEKMQYLLTSLINRSASLHMVSQDEYGEQQRQNIYNILLDYAKSQ